jgi:hypothetical protein
VEDWKITIPSYDMLPTVPFSFDEVYWEAYWKVVNEPTKVVHSVIQKLEHEIKMKKMADQKHKLEKDRAERLQAEKKQDELRLQKRKKSLNPPLNHQYLFHLNPSFPKMNTDKRREEMNLPLNHRHPREGSWNLPLHHYQLKTKLKMHRRSC